jgi:hypothetical protein
LFWKRKDGRNEAGIVTWGRKEVSEERRNMREGSRERDTHMEIVIVREGQIQTDYLQT